MPEIGPIFATLGSIRRSVEWDNSHELDIVTGRNEEIDWLKL
jgi:hypothetical protein